MKNLEEFFFRSANIAIVRTDKLGDMILTLPMFKVLKELCPEKKLTLIASNYVKPLLLNCLYIDQIHFIEDYKNGIKDIFKEGNFDVIFFPRPRFNEALSAFLNGHKLRIGSGYRWYSFLFNYKIFIHRKTAEMHEAEYNINMIEHLVSKKLSVELVKPCINESDIEKINIILQKEGLIQHQFLIIHPGSGGSSYEWSPKNFGKLAEKIFEQTGLKSIITGSNSDEQKCSKAQKYSPHSINLCSQLSLNELMALISLSKMLIANSTGIIHLAAAIGIKVLGLYPNTPHLSPLRWGPYSKDSICVTPPATNQKSRDDMSLIDIDLVLQSAISLIEK